MDRRERIKTAIAIAGFLLLLAYALWGDALVLETDLIHEETIQ